MILEVAILNVKAGLETEFEAVFTQAQQIISSMSGYIDHELKWCIENRSRCLLLVNWESVEGHTVGFLELEGHAQWRKILHHFYYSSPSVKHYENL
jgi:heme-degrading monooxygenase HmoA